MRGLKGAVCLALVLAFCAGVGAGAWLGDLRAAPDEPRTVSIDKRVEAWSKAHDLTKSQERQIRDVLLRYDADRRNIRSEMSKDQWARVHKLRLESREKIDRILREGDSAPVSGG